MFLLNARGFLKFHTLFIVIVLLFTPFSVTRFAIHKICSDRRKMPAVINCGRHINLITGYA